MPRHENDICGNEIKIIGAKIPGIFIIFVF